jgi:hypothetical protein
MTSSISDTDISNALMQAIANTRSVAPRDIALALMKPTEPWQKLLPRIRSVAVDLRKSGDLVFIRKNKIVDPEGLKGVYRFAQTHSVEKL